MEEVECRLFQPMDLILSLPFFSTQWNFVDG